MSGMYTREQLIYRIEANHYETSIPLPHKDASKTARNLIRQARDADVAVKHYEFKMDLAITFNVNINPELTDKMFSMAWDAEHSNGLIHVLYYFEELAYIVRLAVVPDILHH